MIGQFIVPLVVAARIGICSESNPTSILFGDVRQVPVMT